MNSELITIKTFLYAHEAAIARSVLEAEGIYCFLKDEFTIQANPFYSNALGGVKLQVREDDAEQAKIILVSNGYTDTASTDMELSVENHTGTLDNCPSCQSTEFAQVKKPSGLFFGLPILFFGFPFPVFTTQYHCYNCGKDIKVKKTNK